jgi:nucleotide-binding universal stress UspA family protein
MFTQILWATDGSDHADRAFELAKSLASRDGAKLVAFHTVEREGGAGSRGAFTEDANEAEHQGKLRAQVKELSDQGVQAELKMVEGGPGGPAHRIADAAKEIGADLIVVGTRGHTPLHGLLVGSVTQRLLHVAPCPVLAVPPEQT